MYQDFEITKVKEKDGKTIVILHMKEKGGRYDAELSSEFGTIDERDITILKKSALGFVKKQMPKLKMATIVVMSGATILASFPIQKAEAHVADFNMTYLYFGNTKSYISQIDKTHGNLSLVSPSYFDLNLDGSLKITTQFDPYFVDEMHNRGIKVVPFLSNHWDRSIGRAALANRELLSTQIADFINKNNLDGVQVDIENVTDVDRENYTDLVRLLREKIPADKEVSVAVAANPNGWTKGWHGSYDYKELAKYASYLMIMAYDESYTGGKEGPVASYGWVDRSIQYAINQDVPPEKVVLGIPFYGRFWKEGDASGGIGISNIRVDEMLAKYGGTVVFDEAAKSPKAVITIKDGDPTTTIAGKTLTSGTYHIWYENHESIKAKLSLVHKYNIKGTGSWSLGQENASIWKDYRAWMSHDGVIDVAPTTPSQPKEQIGTISPTTATYTVKPGDSLWKVATNHKMTVTQLKELNNLTSDVIYVGQVLKVGNQATPATKQPVVNEPPASTPGAITAPTKEAVTTPPPSRSVKPTAPKVDTKAPTPKVKRYPTLKVGSKGAAVKDMQTKLKKLGFYKGKIDGSYGAGSRTAVVNFQRKYKIKADGVAGPSTLAKLDSLTASKPVKTVKKASVKSVSVNSTKLSTSAPAKTVAVKKYPSLKVGSRGAAVSDMQIKLKKLGLYKGKIEGIYDPTTKSAVIAFQKKYKLKPDGVAGPSTLSKLEAVTGSK